MNNLPSSTPVLWTLGGPENQWNFNAYPIHQKITKLLPKISNSDQNEVQTGTINHQNPQKVKKVKSNEHINICNTFERLGHQNSREFPFKNHQETWLQSKCDFELFKSEKIWTSDAEGSPMGDPKSIKNHWKSIPVPSEWTLEPNDHQNNEKSCVPRPRMLEKWCPKTSKNQ